MKRRLDTADAASCHFCMDAIIPGGDRIVIGFIDRRKRVPQRLEQFHVNCYGILRAEEPDYRGTKR